MLRGIYTSASGMLVESMKTDIAANNLANAQTHGFKKQVASVQAFPEMFLHRINDPGPGHPIDTRPPIGFLGTGAAIDTLPMDLTEGPLKFTGRSLDFALLGPGFFSVELPNGETAFTRDGRFDLDADGYIVGAHGGRLLGSEGPILIGQQPYHIDEEGQVWMDETVVNQLLIVEFENPHFLERLGSNLLSSNEASGAPLNPQSTSVRGEYLEDSNVVVVKEMVGLIATQRAYEANQRMIVAHDETVGRLINETIKLT